MSAFNLAAIRIEIWAHAYSSCPAGGESILSEAISSNEVDEGLFNEDGPPASGPKERDTSLPRRLITATVIESTLVIVFIASGVPVMVTVPKTVVIYGYSEPTV